MDMLDLFEEDAAPQTLPADSMTKVVAMVEYIESLGKTLADAEAHVKELKEIQRRAIEIDLPDAMGEAGLSSFSTSTGRKVSLETFVSGSIPKSKQAEAFAWLRLHGHGGLIKRELSVAFGKGDDATASEIRRFLEHRSLQVEDKETIHSSTLAAWARECLASGEAIPLELLGIYTAVRAKIK